MKWLHRWENWASNYINLMAFIRTLLSFVTGILSVFIFLHLFGYMHS